MLEKIIIYTFVVLTFDAMTYFYGNPKYRGYVGINDYLKLFSNPLYLKTLLTKIFVVNAIVIFFSILFN
nr:hypothetical protein [uncultured Cetobacterium sp.]